MDRIEEVGKEGICSQCQEEKMIIASQDGEIYSKQLIKIPIYSQNFMVTLFLQNLRKFMKDIISIL
jgi:hypothetical protein